MKQCNKCKEWKDKSEFWKTARNKDGLSSKCKTCLSEYSAHLYMKKNNYCFRYGTSEQTNGIIITCSKCGEKKHRSKFHIDRSKKFGIRYSCASCYNYYMKSVSATYLGKEDKRILRKEYYAKKVATVEGRATLMCGKKRGYCSKKDIEFDLTIDWYIKHLKKGCELTKIPFDLSTYVGYQKNIYGPSVDRIIPGGSYTKNNCRMILSCINCFRQRMSDNEMYKLTEALLKYRGNNESSI